MADIKNFSLAGVASSVQFGKRGAQLKQASDAFSFRTAADNAFANVDVADPSLADHAATKRYVDTEIGAINTARIQDDKTTPTAFVGTAEAGDEGKVVIAADAGTNEATKVATFQSGEAANASFVFDNASADTLSFSAVGESANVDLKIAPKGDGVVEIGIAGENSTVQADEGNDLILAGGDIAGAGSTGGDLVLRPGSGETEGSVLIADAAQATVVEVTGTAAATNHVTLTNGTTAVTMGAAGVASDIDVVVAPKGNGKVDVSTSIVSNVVDPVAAQDAATKNYVDTSVATSIATDKVGSLQTREMDIGAASANLGAPVKGRIRRVMVRITQAYTGNAQINVGYAGNTDSLVSSAEIDETTVGTYELNSVDLSFGTATQLVATITGDFGFTGAGKIIIEYIQG